MSGLISDMSSNGDYVEDIIPVQVSRLRKALKTAGAPPAVLINVHGYGYGLNPALLGAS